MAARSRARLTDRGPRVNIEDVNAFTTQLVDAVRVSPLWLSMLILVFASSVEYVFPPFPGDTILIAGGFFAARGAINLYATFAALVAGTVLGCWLGYQIGSFARRSLRLRRFIDWFIKPKYFEKLEALYRKRGRLILVLNRFLPGVRGAFMIGAGLVGLPVSQVLFWGFVSALFWNGLLIGVGYGFSESLPVLLSWFETYTLWTLSALGVLCALALVWALIKKFKRKA